MQKIGQLQAFVEVKETEGAVFLQPEGHFQARLIKMRILSENAVNLYVDPLDEAADPETGEVEQTRFLAHVAPGMEQLEFYYKGSFALRLMGGNVWLDTYDNTSFNVESASPESFARLWEREERDPRILEIEQAARYNQRLLEQQRMQDRIEYEQRLAAMESRFSSVNSPASAALTPTASGTTAGTGVPSAGDSEADPSDAPASGGNA